MQVRSNSPATQLHPVVFWVSSAVIFCILGMSLLAGKRAEGFFDAVRTAAVQQMGWLYVLVTTGVLLFAFWLLFSKYGNIRLGPDDAEPDFGLPTWFAMLFSAGMGIGLLFYGVAEPLLHLAHPIASTASGVPSPSAAMGITFFHWGLHPWGIYAIVGLSLAYFSFRRGLPLSIRSALYPLLGDRVHGWMGNLVDILAVVSTLFGVATSLGSGALQVNAGLNYVFGVAISPNIQLVIIAAITAAATVSVVSGLDVGIRRLSELNMGLAVGLLVFVFAAGPTLYLVQSLFTNLVEYGHRLLTHSLWMGGSESKPIQDWMGAWTVFYWAWWISWAPFVGMFIARVSRGRTVREFLLAVLLAPTLAGFVWLTIFGNAAIFFELNTDVALGEVVADTKTLPTAIFVMLQQLPVSGLTAVVCTVCVILFFVTSSDSASLVIDTIASGGQPHPPIIQRIYWAVLEGVVAALLLMAGGLNALQAAAIATALPFCLVVVCMCVALVRGLAEEFKVAS